MKIDKPSSCPTCGGNVKILKGDDGTNAIITDTFTHIKKKHEFTTHDKDVDMAYFAGVFNAAGVDGLLKELERIKELDMMPHEFFKKLKL